MRRLASLLLLATGPLLLAACATGGHPALADANEPHAVLSQLMQGDIDYTHVRTKLTRVDGEPVGAGNRRSFLLEPGTHTIAFELDVDAWKEFDTGPAASRPDPSRLYADLNEKSIEVDLVEGESYSFGGLIEDHKYVEWTPFIVKSEALD